MNKSLTDKSKSCIRSMEKNNYASAKRGPEKRTSLRLTQEQLDALSAHLHTEFSSAFQRSGTGISLSVNGNVMTVTIEHGLSAAERTLTQHTAGREFFQRYVKELAIQLYAPFIEHIEGVLPYVVSFSSVKVDCENRVIVFSFGVRPKIALSADVAQAKTNRENYA